MAVSELNEDTQDQICDLLENLQQIEKLKNKDIPEGNKLTFKFTECQPTELKHMSLLIFTIKLLKTHILTFLSISPKKRFHS